MYICRFRINDCSHKDRVTVCNKNVEPGPVRWQVIFSPIASEREGCLLHFKIIFLDHRPTSKTQNYQPVDNDRRTSTFIWKDMTFYGGRCVRSPRDHYNLGAQTCTWTHSSLHFFICSGIAVSPWCDRDPLFSHFLHFPTIAWLTGTSFYNFADVWNQWHPPFTECKAEWISSEKKMKRWWWGSLQGAHSISDYVKYWTTNTQSRILNRGIWKCAQATYISPQRTYASLYLKCKTNICIGFLTKQSSIFYKITHISKRKVYSHIDSLEEKA